MKAEEIFTYGRYKGRSLENVWSGQSVITSELVKVIEYEFAKLKDIYPFLKTVKFSLNYFRISVWADKDNFAFTKESIYKILNALNYVFANGQWPWFLSTSEWKKLPESYQNFFSHCQDYTYITNYLIKQEDFKIDYQIIRQLEFTPIHVIRGFRAEDVEEENRIEIYPCIEEIKRQFPKDLVEKCLRESVRNNYSERSDNYNNKSLSFEKYDGPSDGYGNSLDDDFIDDAFGGEPDAYWNID